MNVDSFSKNQQTKLLTIARQSIEHYLANKKKLAITNLDEALNIKRGCFVSLKKDNKLRGCVGQIAPGGPLTECIRDMAIHAAVLDKRFDPVEINELSDINIEISVLTPLVSFRDPKDFSLEEDGVMVRGFGRHGLLLPQVAASTNWTQQQFLEFLCKEKAGLDKSAYLEPTVELFKFRTATFNES
ncbi:MAG: AMMECR1 domain-containing protein [Legionellales bacterium]|nr:AMMECR1 domain-containing protein [Legionellales bacterium]|tara:strand:+ start:37 stop:594 length:558 start_codon:yes stop_codon:yes gene_type:complete